MQGFVDELRLLDAVRLAVVATDTAGVVTFANSAAARVHGTVPGGLAGVPLSELISDPMAAGVVLSTVLAGQTWRGHLQLRRCDGEVWSAAVVGTPIHHGNGAPERVVGAVLVADDQETANGLERAYAQQRLASARSELLREIMSELTTADTLVEVAAVLERHLVTIEALLRGQARLRVPPDLIAVSDGSAFLRKQVELPTHERLLLDDLAAQVGLAAGRAHHQTRTTEIADHLQASLAASALPEIAGVDLAVAYAPGGDELEHVGGDWYDVIVTADDGVVLVVGDVMGRGVPAATTMIRVRAGLRALVTVDPDPGVLLSRADAVVSRDAESQFVTAIAAWLDPTRRVLRLCSAGHIPLLVVHSDGSVESFGDGSGVPLGLLDHLTRSVIEVAVEPGDTIVLVTDGVVEGRDHDVDEGIERLARQMSAGRRHHLRRVVDDVAALADPALLDDVTVLALRIR